MYAYEYTTTFGYSIDCSTSNFQRVGVIEAFFTWILRATFFIDMENPGLTSSERYSVESEKLLSAINSTSEKKGLMLLQIIFLG
jgi:hypothetical protein